MSHKQILGQLALSAALGFAGVAQAADTAGYAVKEAGTSNGFVSSPDKVVKYAPPSVINLGNLIDIPGNVSTVQSCYNQLGIVEKPLSQTNATDARRVVDCADQTSLNEFLDHPSLKHKEVGHMVAVRSQFQSIIGNILNDNESASQLAADCKAKGQVTSEAFTECARAAKAVEQSKKLAISVALSLGFLGGLAVFVHKIGRGQKHILNNNLDNQPS